MRNCIIKTIKTFIATFLGEMSVLVVAMDFTNGKQILLTIAAAAVAALYTAVMNVPRVRRFFKNYGEVPELHASDVTAEMEKLLERISEKEAEL